MERRSRLYVNVVWVNVSITARGRLGLDSPRSHGHTEGQTKTKTKRKRGKYTRAKYRFRQRMAGLIKIQEMVDNNAQRQKIQRVLCLF